MNQKSPTAAAVRRLRLIIGIFIGLAVGAIHAFVSHVPAPSPAESRPRSFAILDAEGNVVALVRADVSFEPR